MTTFIRSAIFAAAVLGSVSAVQARDYLEDNGRIASQYDLNNPDDVKSFWDHQDRRGN